MNDRAICNVSGYRFVDLDEEWIRGLRPNLKERCESAELKGTILLSTEGINVSLSGDASSVEDLLRYLTGLQPFRAMTFKRSFSDRQVYNRMLVKIKREIIAFGVASVRPVEFTAPRVNSATLRSWLDDGRDLVLLDTRNDYEVELGSFEAAVNLDIEDFRSFPKRAEKLPHDLRDKPVVTFCTGGIRCEKAAPHLMNMGFREVYQLEGGILQYFEDCGGDHWVGECFVFDKRVALGPDLKETDTEYCFKCQHVLSVDDRNSPQYELGVSCPFCISLPKGRLE